MLTKIILEHFKCFKKLHLPLAPLTLLAGMNATGKSTVLQALAILHQTVAKNEWGKNLILNDDLISLGTAGDIINQVSGRNEFRIGLSTDSSSCLWTMVVDNRAMLSVPIQHISWEEKDNWQKKKIVLREDEQLHHLLPSKILAASSNAQALSSLISNLSYISADRVGPRETYSISTPEQLKNVGSRGEQTPWFLYHFAIRKPLEGLLIEGTPPTLQRQVEAWMNKFFPGTNLSIEPLKGANLVTLGIRTSEETDFHRPQNVGYGQTHVLPILTACLGSTRSNIVMVENPEAHLHPSGQAAMGEFLARSAASGIQVILETHSDHVLNGIRRAVKKGLITHHDVAIHFFTLRDEKSDHAPVISPLIDKNGNLDQWPADFFDQFDKDMGFLLGW